MKALILVDIQYDFLPGGALPAKDGDEIIPVANRLAASFELVVATQDWHPPEHLSFAANHEGRKEGEVIELNGLEQILWPVHCVQGTHGAELHRDLDRDRIERVFQKGSDPRIDSYSGFFDNGHRKATGLGDYLEGKGVDEVCLAGVATDYCVKYTALDAIELGFGTRVVEDACRGVEREPGDGARALDEVREAGGEITRSDALLG